MLAWVMLPHGSYVGSGLFDTIFFAAPVGAIVFTILGVGQLISKETKRDADEDDDPQSALALVIVFIPVALILAFIGWIWYSISHIGG